MGEEFVLKAYGDRKRSTTTRRAATTISFAAWCARNAAACVLPLKLNADVVAWMVSVLQSGGETDDVENISTLERVLTHRRTKLRFPTERDWDIVMLTARVLLRTWEEGK
jgi:hypothetical protein